MPNPDDLRHTKIPLNNHSASMPALGFGTLIPDPVATRTATTAALQAGFRTIDTAERYRTENEVGEGMQDAFKSGKHQAQRHLRHHQTLEHQSPPRARPTRL